MNFKAHIVSEDELYSVTLLTNSFDYRCPSFVFRGAFRGDKETRANFEGLSRVGIVRLIACGVYPLRVRLVMVFLDVFGGLVVDASFSWELFPKVVACDCIRLVASI